MALFRNCRYEVITFVPNENLWSRHWSYDAARRSFREAVNNRRGDHRAGTLVELRDSAGGAAKVLSREAVRAW